MSEPRISVLIPVWNGEDQIGICLEALSRQTLPKDQFEVVVVDNGSTDRTVQVVARYPFARLVSEPRPGSYRARNTGLEHVRTRYVAFTDADCVPEPDWLEKGLAAAEAHPEAGIISGKVELFRSSADASETCEAYEQLFTLNQEQYAKSGGCATANWISPVALIREVGGFNSALKSSGDFDLAARIRASGRPIVYRPDVTVRHPVRGQIGDILAKQARIVGGQWTLAKEKISAIGFAWKIVKTAVWGAMVVLRRGPRNLWIRLKVLGLLGLIMMSCLCEYARLLIGGAPRRA